MRKFQSGLARVYKGVFETSLIKDNLFFINVLSNITPFVTAGALSSPSIVPDVGIFAGDDIVAVETASIDSIKVEDYIKSSLPKQVKLQEKGAILLEKILWQKSIFTMWKS